MKLAEALLLRADLQKKVDQLTNRLKPVMIVQAGKIPQEDPVKLMAQLRNSIKKLEEIIVKINKTNILTALPDGRPIMEGLAQRDSLKTLIAQLRILRLSAQIPSYNANSMQNTIKVKDLQVELDQTGRAFREIDTQIQEINWTTELKD